MDTFESERTVPTELAARIEPRQNGRHDQRVRPIILHDRDDEPRSNRDLTLDFDPNRVCVPLGPALKV